MSGFSFFQNKLATDEAVNSGGLRGCQLSTRTNVGAGYELSIMYFTRHYFIAFVMRSAFITQYDEFSSSRLPL
jgi:hypothetical protein